MFLALYKPNNTFKIEFCITIPHIEFPLTNKKWLSTVNDLMSKQCITSVKVTIYSFNTHGLDDKK